MTAAPPLSSRFMDRTHRDRPTTTGPPSSSLLDWWRSDRFTVALALIALAGLVFRIAYVVWNRNGLVGTDGYFFHLFALQLVDGVGFRNPTTGAAIATNPPAWSVVLAGPSMIGFRSELWQQLIACVVGTATIVMTGLAGRAAFGRRVGIAAAALAAAYPFVWLYERELVAEPLAMLGTATTIWLAYKFKAAPSVWLAVALGAAVGVLAMTRSELLGISVLLVVPVVLSARRVSLRNRFRWLVAAAVVCVAVVAPWAIYNQTRFARPVPLSTSLGPAMVTGNCPPTYHGKLLGYYVPGCALFVSDVSTDASIADNRYRRAAWDFVSANKKRVPVVAAARVGRTFGLFRPTQQMHLEAERGTEVLVLRLGFYAYWILLPLAIAGFVLARRRGVAVYPLLAFPVLIVLAVLPTIGLVRYRAPAEIPLLILAAVAIEALVTLVRYGRAGPAAAQAPKAIFTRG